MKHRTSKRRLLLGITLIELLFSVFLFAMILTVSFLPFKIMSDSFKLGGARGDISSNSRIQLQAMVRTLQQGAYMTYGSSTDGSTASIVPSGQGLPVPQIPKGETNATNASLVAQYIYTQVQCSYFNNSTVNGAVQNVNNGVAAIPVIYYTAAPTTPGADATSECSLIQAEQISGTWQYKILIPRGIYQCYFIPHPDVTPAYKTNKWGNNALPVPYVSANTNEYAYMQIELQIYPDDATRPLPASGKTPVSYSEQCMIINGSEQIPPNQNNPPPPPAAPLNRFLYPGWIY